MPLSALFDRSRNRPPSSGDQPAGQEALWRRADRNAVISAISTVTSTVNSWVVPAGVGAVIATGLTTNLLPPVILSLTLTGITIVTGAILSRAFARMDVDSKFSANEMVVEAIKEMPLRLKEMLIEMGWNPPAAASQQALMPTPVLPLSLDLPSDIPLPTPVTRTAPIIDFASLQSESPLENVRKSVTEHTSIEVQRQAVERYQQQAREFTLADKYASENNTTVIIYDHPDFPNQPEFQITYIIDNNTKNIEVYYGEQATGIIAIPPKQDQSAGAQLFEVHRGQATLLGDGNNILQAAYMMDNSQDNSISYSTQELIKLHRHHENSSIRAAAA